jgi:hypothetical protein
MDETQIKYVSEAVRLVEVPTDIKTFTSDDFTDFKAPSSRGGERRVILAERVDTGERVAIKLHRHRKLMQQIITKHRRLFEPYKQYRKLNPREAEMERGYETPEDEIEKMFTIDWKKTLQSPGTKKAHNDLVIKSIRTAERLTKISPMVPQPLGVYVTRNGLLGEVYRAYDGSMAQNFTNPDKAKPLTDEQYEYFEEQLRSLQDAGVSETGDELQLNNVIVTGDGREDIIFAELPE